MRRKESHTVFEKSSKNIHCEGPMQGKSPRSSKPHRFLGLPLTAPQPPELMSKNHEGFASGRGDGWGLGMRINGGIQEMMNDVRFHLAAGCVRLCADANQLWRWQFRASLGKLHGTPDG